MTILCAMIKFIGKLLLGIALFVFHIFMLLVDMGTPS